MNPRSQQNGPSGHFHKKITEQDATHMLVDFDAIAERICPEAATLQFFKQHGAELRAIIAKAAGR
jgi:hypothetical protein